MLESWRVKIIHPNPYEIGNASKIPNLAVSASIIFLHTYVHIMTLEHSIFSVDQFRAFLLNFLLIVDSRDQKHVFDQVVET